MCTKSPRGRRGTPSRTRRGPETRDADTKRGTARRARRPDRRGRTAAPQTAYHIYTAMLRVWERQWHSPLTLDNTCRPVVAHGMLLCDSSLGPAAAATDILEFSHTRRHTSR